MKTARYHAISALACFTWAIFSAVGTLMAVQHQQGLLCAIAALASVMFVIGFIFHLEQVKRFIR